MSDVKRTYHAPQRRQQAQATRDKIVTAAARLFAREGYRATTNSAIAREAGVAVQTIYATFGSKRAILLALLDTAESKSGIEQTRERATIDTDPATQIRSWAHFSRRLFAELTDILTLIHRTGTAEPDLADLWQTGEARRRDSARDYVASWVARGALRADVEPDIAVDAVWAVTGPDLYRLLVIESGWSDQQYEDWFTTQLEALLDERFRSADLGTKSSP